MESSCAANGESTLPLEDQKPRAMPKMSMEDSKTVCLCKAGSKGMICDICAPAAVEFFLAVKPCKPVGPAIFTTDELIPIFKNPQEDCRRCLKQVYDERISQPHTDIYVGNPACVQLMAANKEKDTPSIVVSPSERSSPTIDCKTWSMFGYLNRPGFRLEVA